jgi:hypothetical protein
MRTSLGETLYLSIQTLCLRFILMNYQAIVAFKSGLELAECVISPMLGEAYHTPCSNLIF